MRCLLSLLIVQCLLVSTLAYTLPGFGRRAATWLSMSDANGGSAVGKANAMLRKKKVKEAEALKAEMAAEGDTNPINVSIECFTS